MKAVLCKSFDGPGALTVEETDPGPLGAKDIRMRVYTAAVGFADILMVEGKYQLKPPLPFTPGLEAAGEITEVGPEVTLFRVGDRAAFGALYGAFAEEVVVQEESAYKLPDGVDYATGSAYRSSHGTSYHALEHRAHLQPGETLLVHGAAGGVGLAAVELGKLMGARVIGCVGSDDKLEIVRRYGADHVLNYTGGFKEQIKDLTGGKGADVIYDPVGGDVFDESLRCIAPGGRLLVIGFASGRIPSAPANLILLKNCSVVGVVYGNWRRANPEAGRAMNEVLLNWCAEGKLKPHVSMSFPLGEVQAAMEALSSRRATGKVLLQVRPA
jgi:NADPH2:quinone reductase